ncbi:phosphopantetheine-binding protein [Nocardia sp. NPDC046473]|uniref:phosphopantetheine-binding protein n=1 Tax=Nocardia sp. NPDC046473 TaxID=3155733 RepID=UPI0034104114
MNAPVPRYVLVVSGRTAETLVVQADTLATYLAATEQDPRRAAFGGTVTLATVAKTLLRHRAGLPHRFAFVATRLSDAVESLRFFVEHQDSANQLRGKGIYANRVEMDSFGDRLAADQEYVRQLAANGSYDRLAALWSVGFPIDWVIVHPELEVELPAYLPPTQLSRQRFWPKPATIGRAASKSPQEPGRQTPPTSPTDGAAATGATGGSVASATNAASGAPETSATGTPAVMGATGASTASAVPGAPDTYVAEPAVAMSAVTGEPALFATVPTTPTAVADASVAFAALAVSATSDGDLRAELAELPSTLRRQLLRGRLQGWIGDALAYPDGELPAVDMGFFDIGMTSIHLEEVRTRISAVLGFQPDETTAFDYPTIAEFAEYLERSLDSAVAQPVSVPEVPPARVVDRSEGENILTALDSAAIDELSPVELERVLTAIL